MELVGKIININRYPVKSFAGESLEACKIDTYGLYGDRFCAFYDETMVGWDSFITARTIPNMLTYKAKFIEDELKISSPDGRTFTWNEDLLGEIQKYSRRKISMTAFKAPNPEEPELMSVDSASVLIITDATLRKLEAITEKKLDKHRFRANLIISVDDKMFNECDWLGKRLFIGSTELKIDSYCQRCSMITIDPVTLERDPLLLKKLNEEMNLNFGVYASVKKTGQINVGDKVYLVDSPLKNSTSKLKIGTFTSLN